MMRIQYDADITTPTEKLLSSGREIDTAYHQQ
jgi:hypothetical protein